MDKRVVDLLSKRYKPVNDSSKRDSGGNVPVECLHCAKQFWGSATRQRAHLLAIKGKGVAACSLCPEEVLEELTALEREIADGGKKRSRAESFTLTGCSQAASSGTTARAPARQTDIRETMTAQNKEDLDLLAGQLFYQAGIPFNLARCKEYFDCFTSCKTSTNVHLSYAHH